MRRKNLNAANTKENIQLHSPPYKITAEFRKELPGKTEMGMNSPGFNSDNITRVPPSCCNQEAARQMKDL